MKTLFRLATISLFVVGASSLYSNWNNDSSKEKSSQTAVSAVKSSPATVETKESSQISADEIILNHPDLSTFSKSLKAADLLSVLQDEGPFTVFAPNNSAFKDYSDDELKELLKPENREDLKDLVLYHIIRGKFLSSDLKEESVKTLNGDELIIDHDSSGNLSIDDASIVKPDILGKNGVIHIIDTVLQP